MCVKCSHGVERAQENIRQAIRDYGRYTSQTEVLEDVSEKFIAQLAAGSMTAKKALRDMFRKSPAWNEELQTLVINGTRTHNPDLSLIWDLAIHILTPAMRDADFETRDKIHRAIRFFTNPESEFEDGIDAIKSLAPKAYAPNKKRSRIFKALCDALGVTDNSAGSDFQKYFAQFADELSTHKINFKLFASINPAHFLTMSNPKDDARGDMLTSCHSFNSTIYTYNCGCTGYALDNYTFVVFTVADPNIPELFNNRKTSRQIFAYKPNNGLLLQSRLYNTCGGTRGEQKESRLYRDLIQREISAIEGVPNLWKTFDYFGNEKVQLPQGYGFGGYPDWEFKDFKAKVSIRADHAKDFEAFEIGSFGLCIKCGSNIKEGLYCDNCKPDNREICDNCGERCDDRWAVYDFYGNTIYVCEDCLREYSCCEHCEEYYPRGEMICIDNGVYVCQNCLDAYYSPCEDCENYYPTDYLYSAVDGDGHEFFICENCRDSYEVCDECGRYVSYDDCFEVYNSDSEPVRLCRDCLENSCYEKCAVCGELYHEDALLDGVCRNCRENEGGE